MKRKAGSPKEPQKRGGCLLLLALVILFTARGTRQQLGKYPDKPQIYGGVRVGYKPSGGGGHMDFIGPAIGKVLGTLDLLPSFILDTALLPFTLTAPIARHFQYDGFETRRDKETAERNRAREREAAVTAKNKALRTALLERIRESIEPGADMKEKDLSGCDLSGKDLRGADFTGANLRGADLTGADLSDAKMSKANLRSAILRDAKLEGVNLERASLTNANLTNANLEDANLLFASLYGANLRGAALAGVNLAGADLRHDVVNPPGSGIDLKGANLTEASLAGASLAHANLRGANLTNANLRGAGVEYANLNGAQIQGADLRFGYATGVTLEGTKGKPKFMPVKLEKIEGERMHFSLQNGSVFVQNMRYFSGKRRQWSNHRQLLWTKAKEGDVLDIKFTAATSSKQELFVVLTKANDYGIVQLAINGKNVGKPIDCFNPEVTPTGEISLGVFDLSEGEHVLRATISGSNDKAKDAGGGWGRHLFGLDYLRMVK